MPPPQQLPPLLPQREATVMLVCLGIGAFILGVASWVFYAYRIDLWVMDFVDSLITPFVTAYTFDAFLVMIGLTPVPQPLPMYKRVLPFLRGVLPLGNTEPVKKTLIAWIIQSAKDIGVATLKKGIELLSAYFSHICVVVILVMMYKKICSMDNTIRELQTYIHNLERNAVLREERLTGLIMQGLQRLDDFGAELELQRRRAASSPLQPAPAVPDPPPDLPPLGLISRAGHFVTGFAADRIAEATGWTKPP